MRVFGQSLSQSEAVILLILLVLFVYRLFFRNRIDVGENVPTSVHMDSSLPGDITNLSTEWGDIYIRVFDPVKDGHTTEEHIKATPSLSIPIVCLPGINHKLVSGKYRIHIHTTCSSIYLNSAAYWYHLPGICILVCSLTHTHSLTHSIAHMTHPPLRWMSGCQ